MKTYNLWSGVALVATHTFAADWCYENCNMTPDLWSTGYAECGGTDQSPVDLAGPLENTLLQDKLLPLGTYSGNGLVWELSNNGHTLQATAVEFDGYVQVPNYVINKADVSGETTNYIFAQTHLHWGNPNNDLGSEHTVNGASYPLETHLVHYNGDNYNSFNEAVAGAEAGDRTALLVLGVFFEEDPTQYDKSLEQIVGRADLREADTSVRPTIAFNPYDWVPANPAFYHYEGSLTTPPCHESVLWIVFKQPLVVHQDQLTALTVMCASDVDGAESSECTVNTINYRPVQDLGSRTLYFSSTLDNGSRLASLFNSYDPTEPTKTETEPATAETDSSSDHSSGGH
eukprot:Clim_evm10s43 gene=Clim_evmTU10s43